MEDLTIRLGKHIRSLRQKNDLTQEKLAELADINITFLGQIERGTKNPTVETLNKLAMALEISLPELLSFDQQQIRYHGKDGQLDLILLEFCTRIKRLFEEK